MPWAISPTVELAHVVRPGAGSATAHKGRQAAIVCHATTGCRRNFFLGYVLCHPFFS